MATRMLTDLSFSHTADQSSYYSSAFSNPVSIDVFSDSESLRIPRSFQSSALQLGRHIIHSNMQNKIIAITGGASGIGLALAKLLLQNGASVSIADISTANLDKALQDLGNISGPDKVLATKVGVTQLSEIETWLSKTIERFGQIDGAANVAGVSDHSSRRKSFEDQSHDDWNWVLDVNLNGVARCMKSELKVMKTPGSIVNVTSVSGLRGGWGSAAYTASKHGVVGLTRNVAKEYGPKDIRVNAVAPGVIDTQMVKDFEEASENGAGASDRAVKGLPIHRKGMPEEVARLMMFLLSEESSFVTGAIYSIDGGINI